MLLTRCACGLQDDQEELSDAAARPYVMTYGVVLMHLCISTSLFSGAGGPGRFTGRGWAKACLHILAPPRTTHCRPAREDVQGCTREPACTGTSRAPAAWVTHCRPARDRRAGLPTMAFGIVGFTLAE